MADFVLFCYPILLKVKREVTGVDSPCYSTQSTRGPALVEHELITCRFQQILNFLHLVASAIVTLTVRAVSIMAATVPTAITKVT